MSDEESKQLIPKKAEKYSDVFTSLLNTVTSVSPTPPPAAELPNPSLITSPAAEARKVASSCKTCPTPPLSPPQLQKLPNPFPRPSLSPSKNTATRVCLPSYPRLSSEQVSALRCVPACLTCALPHLARADMPAARAA